jgi:hypothetical protein
MGLGDSRAGRTGVGRLHDRQGRHSAAMGHGRSSVCTASVLASAARSSIRRSGLLVLLISVSTPSSSPSAPLGRLGGPTTRSPSYFMRGASCRLYASRAGSRVVGAKHRERSRCARLPLSRPASARTGRTSSGTSDVAPSTTGGSGIQPSNRGRRFAPR